ncbi:hypothetical protein BDW22DRAFT_1088765 [Trametopsis cervina]|nr:hypothetical protein BDW22DRAFT_1088765 [Trametopsis cervina]
MGSVLLQTPSETLIHILSYLDWRQLVSAQRISRLFQELIRSSVELQYIIELGADDLVDNVDQDKCGLVTTQDRLTLLLDRRRRWRTLDWTYKASISLPYEYGDFKLIGGVFVGQVDNVTASSALLAIWPHTKSDLCADGTEQQQRAVGGDMPFWTKESAIDPTQDLLALLTRDVSLGIIVHLSTLSLRETHPLATISPLIFPTILSVTPQMGVSMSPLQIIGDIISVNFFWGERYTGHHYLHIFNWHTGALLVNLETDLSHRPTFLSPRAYMIASIYDSGSLDLYEIHDSTTSSDTVEPPTRVLRLRLPKVLPNRRLDLTTVQSSSYLADPEALHSPFIQRQGRGIHLVTLFYTSQLVFALHVKNETLLGMMAQPVLTLQRPGLLTLLPLICMRTCWRGSGGARNTHASCGRACGTSLPTDIVWHSPGHTHKLSLEDPCTLTYASLISTCTQIAKMTRATLSLMMEMGRTGSGSMRCTQRRLYYQD